MLSLFFLIGILAVVARCDENNACGAKYVTINTFETRSSFKVTCYGNQSDCNVYYTPAGTGCDVVSPTLVGTIPANKTQVLTSDFSFGGAFCSDNQIGVFNRDDGLDIVDSQLPRPTDAGTKFRVHIVANSDDDVPYQCGIFGLSISSQVSLDINDVKETISVSRFENHPFSFTANSSSETVITAISDNPVIISCVSAPVLAGKLLVNFQPISSEPVLLVAQYSDHVSVALSDCLTNELIKNFAKAKISIGGYDDTCQSSSAPSDDLQIFTLTRCVLYVEPLEDGVCVSVMKRVRTIALGEMGIPESRLATQFADNLLSLSFFQFFSFRLVNCVVDALSTSNWPSSFKLSWIAGDVDKKVATELVDYSFDEVNWIECDGPVFFMYSGGYRFQSFVSIPLANKFWQPFFEAECSIPGNLTPATKSPSSGSRCLTSWVVFLGISIFCIGLF